MYKTSQNWILSYCPARGQKNNVKGEGEAIAKSFWIWRRKCKCLRTQAPGLLLTPARTSSPVRPRQGWGCSPPAHISLATAVPLRGLRPRHCPSRGPGTTALAYFRAEYLNAASNKSPPGLAIPLFRTPICRQLSIPHLTAVLTQI